MPYRRDDLCATDRNLGDFEMSDPKNDEATGSEAATEQEPLTLRGHSGELFSVAWSGDGKRLASASEGRKTYTSSALVDPDGRVLGRAEHLWVAVDPAQFA